MQCANDKTQACPVCRPCSRLESRAQGLTLVEMVIAMSIIVIIFAVVVPQFRAILNSWDSRAGAGETIQNGRVLIEHINRNLSKAVKITAVSGSAVTNGYIEFENNDANNLRYDVNGTSGYVEFGLVGDLSDLAGPVSQLQFTCYDACDLDTPITDVNSIRSVKVETTLTNAEALGQDKSFIAQAYLRANASSGGGAAGLGKYTAFEFDATLAQNPALAQIDSTHYLCAYSSVQSDGFAVVLTVDTGTWDITAGTALEYDTQQGLTPALAQIDSTHYLCAYTGWLSDGFAVVLTVDTGTWNITAGTPLEYDGANGQTPALAQIDSTHYLCVYDGDKDDGWAVVLTVDTGTWNITAGTPLEYDGGNGQTPALAQIDSTHYLCAYTGVQGDGFAVVLTVDTGTWNITAETPFEYDTLQGQTPALAQIDSTHYLCTYKATNSVGNSVVLTVDTGTWAITKGTPFQYISVGNDPALAQIDGTNYLCAYSDSNSMGEAVVQTVDTGTWNITNGTTSFQYDSTKGQTPALAQIDSSDYLCAYSGEGNDGWAVVLNYTAGGGGGQILP